MDTVPGFSTSFILTCGKVFFWLVNLKEGSKYIITLLISLVLQLGFHLFTECLLSAFSFYKNRYASLVSALSIWLKKVKIILGCSTWNLFKDRDYMFSKVC